MNNASALRSMLVLSFLLGLTTGHGALALTKGENSEDSSFTSTAVAEDEIYLFSYFKSSKGVHLAASEDGLHFKALNDDQPIMMPADWSGGDLTRDPSIVYNDGQFHMVWGIAHSGNSFGYAESSDLVTWSKPVRVQPFTGETQPSNVWAPEICWDPVQKNYMIVFSSSIGFGHRLFVTRTVDGVNFSEAEGYFDPGFMIIDGSSVFFEKDGEPQWAMVYKKVASVEDGGKNLTVALAPADFSAPWISQPHPIIGPGTEICSNTMTEGPTLMKTASGWRLYWDAPQGGFYGMASSPDLVNWTDHTDELDVPDNARHGTIFRAPRAVVGWTLPFEERK